MKKCNHLPVLLFMKLSLMQGLISCLFVSLSWATDVAAQEMLDRRVTVQAHEKPVKTVIALIAQSANVSFSYSPQIIQARRKISFQAHNSPLSEVLGKLLPSLQLTYSVAGNQLILKPLVKSTTQENKPELPDDASLLNSLDEQLISGIVRDEKGDALPGVNILLKGSAKGTTTDAQGQFSITVPNGERQILIFSFVGYQRQEVSVGNQISINVTLRADNQTLNEVVVVGYGTQNRKDLTGAVAVVNMKELESVPLVNAAQALQGRAAGVTVTQVNGRPGAGFAVQVRGVGTISNTDPLYVIDGVIGAGGGNNINPNDIESIQVLKDASAAAIYGSRAANGVVVITTRRGKSGKTRVSFDTYYGVQNAWKKLPVLTARQYAEYSNEMQRNGGQALIPALSNPAALPDITNWQDEIFRTAPMQEYNLSVSGGSENASFLVSGNYFKQDGILITNSFDRYSFRANSDFKVGKVLKIGQSLGLAFTNSRNDEEGLALANAIHMPTYIPVFNPNVPGEYGGPNVADGMDAKNPVRILQLQDRSNRGLALIGNIYADASLLPGLSYRLSLGLTYNTDMAYNFLPQYRAGERDINAFSTLSESAGNSVSPLLENTLTYTKTLGLHQFTILGGYTRQWSNYRSLGANVRNFPSPDIRVLPAATELQTVSGQAGSWALTSLLSRINYQYAEKYLFTASLRRDGSSRFAADKRFGVFPSASVGWRISEEAFMKKYPFVSNLKLRAGWGQLGMQELDDYPYQGGLFNTSRYILGDAQTVAPAISQRELANRDISWETVSTTDIGLEAGFLNNSLTLEIDYFTRSTRDILLQLPLAASSGVAVAPTVNGATVNNKGLEVSLGHKSNYGKLSVSANVNASLLLENQVTSLGNRTQPIFGAESVNRTLAGDQIGHFFGYRVDRIYQTQSEIDADNALAVSKGKILYQTARTAPGDIRFRDLNNDGTINADDREKLGGSIPTFTFGGNLSLGYRNLDFSVMFQGVGGHFIYNKDRALYTESMKRSFNTFTSVLNRWTPENPSTTMPRAVGNDPNDNARFSDRWVEKGDYGRIKLVTVGYTLSPSQLTKLTGGHLSRLRLYITAQNLLTFTNVSTWDPEFTGRGAFSNTTRGIAESIYPQARTFLAGLQVAF